MKRTTITAILALFLAFPACDDITSEPNDPRAPQKTEEPVTLANPDPSKEVTRQKLIEAYNFIVDNRNGMVKWKDTLEPMMKAKHELFPAERAKFLQWVDARAIMINIRLEWIDPATHHLTNDHPAIPIASALRIQKQMIDDFIYHYQLNRPLPPDRDKEIKKLLDDFQQRMKTWQWPEEEKAEPTIINR